jgi:hypothetical protein
MGETNDCVLTRDSAHQGSAMTFDGTSVAKTIQPQSAIAVHKRRLQERLGRQPSQHQAERPTSAYYVVYFATVALLFTLCVVSVFH